MKLRAKEDMKLNDKNVASFAVCSSPVDKEGYLLKKGDLNRDFQRRWFILKGNLLFYFQKKQDKEPLGVVVLEACSVQISTHGRYSFEISFDGPGTRTYVFGADNDEDLQSWMKAISHSSYEYLRSIVNELQRRVSILTSSSADGDEEASGMSLLHVGPRKASPRAPHRSKSEKIQGSGGHSPKPQQQKVKVKNGILVDIDETEAPPIPVKKKSNTIHRSSPGVQKRGGGGGDKDSPDRASPLLVKVDKSDIKESEADAEDNSDAAEGAQEEVPPLPNKLRTVQTMSTAPPHSSPYIPHNAFNPSKPLSPVSTLDRTPILEPIPALKVPTSPPPSSSSSPSTARPSTSNAVPTKPSAEDNDYDEVPPTLPPRPQQNGVVNVHPDDDPGSPQPLRPLPPPPSRQVAAPLDPNKSMYEMHTEFTKAMEDVRSQRNAQS